MHIPTDKTTAQLTIVYLEKETMSNCLLPIGVFKNIAHEIYYF